MSKRPEEGRKLEGHSYDGIEELDHSLPTWWLASFYGTVIFAVVYFVHYSLGEGTSIQEEYDRARAQHDTAQLVSRASAPALSDADLTAIAKDPARVQAGVEIYRTRCLACHGDQAQGGIGPNLTDAFWLHGGKPAQILASITNGVLDKGMPPWGPQLKPEEIQSVTAFVLSVKGTRPTGAKAPQGTEEKE